MKALFRQIVIGTALAMPLSAGSATPAEETLIESYRVCLSNGTDATAIVGGLLSLRWRPLAATAIDRNAQELFAVRFLANAAFRTQYSPTWEQAWNEGVLKAKRAANRLGKPSRFLETRLFTNDGKTGLLLLKTSTSPSSASVSCYMIDGNASFADYSQVPHADQQRVRPVGVLDFFFNGNLEDSEFKAGLTGVRLDAILVNELLGHPIPANAYINTYVTSLPKE